MQQVRSHEADGRVLKISMTTEVKKIAGAIAHVSREGEPPLLLVRRRQDVSYQLPPSPTPSPATHLLLRYPTATRLPD